MSSGDELRELVVRGVERMLARRESERVIADLAKQGAESLARQLIVYARIERVKLRWELEERFGFVLSHSKGGYACRFEGSRPWTPEQAARWTDLFVHAIAFEGALLAMRAAVADFPHPDRARMLVNAFLDAMREGEPEPLQRRLQGQRPRPAEARPYDIHRCGYPL